MWILVWIALGCTTALATEDLTASVSVTAERSPDDWIAAVDNRFGEIEHLRYSAHRTIERNGARVEDRWRFIRRGETEFRVDYFGDTVRQIASDGNTFIDFVPAKKKALRFHFERMSAQEQADLFARVLQKIAVPGIRMGVAQDVVWKRAPGDRWQEHPAVYLEGQGEHGTLRAVIDPERLVLLSSEIHQDGQVVLRTEASDHRLVAPGVYYPHTISAITPYAGGEVRVTIHLTKVSTAIEDLSTAFEVDLPSGIEVEDLP